MIGACAGCSAALLQEARECTELLAAPTVVQSVWALLQTERVEGWVRFLSPRLASFARVASCWLAPDPAAAVAALLNLSAGHMHCSQAKGTMSQPCGCSKWPAAPCSWCPPGASCRWAAGRAAVLFWRRQTGCNPTYSPSLLPLLPQLHLLRSSLLSPGSAGSADHMHEVHSCCLQVTAPDVDLRAAQAVASGPRTAQIRQYMAQSYIQHSTLHLLGMGP